MLVMSHKLLDRTFFHDLETDRVGVIQLTDIDRAKVRIGFRGGPTLKFYREGVLTVAQVAELEAKLKRQGGK